MGIKYKASPTEKQKFILSQWMGCVRVIWNAKCEEDAYLRTFAKKYLPIGTYAPINATFSQYKNKTLTPWLSRCPSQLLRNSASRWYTTYRNFLKGRCGRPRKKKKHEGGSLYITRELFRFERCSDGNTRLFIGSKHNNIGYLSLKVHRKVKPPNAMTIKQKNGKYTVSFCYEDELSEKKLVPEKEKIAWLSQQTPAYLNRVVEGIDRGVQVVAQGTSKGYTYTDRELRKQAQLEKKKTRYQRWMSRQQKVSKRRKKSKKKIAKIYGKQVAIRDNFCHQTSRKLVNKKEIEVIAFEALPTNKMTRKPKAKPDGKGGWLKNKAKAKAGLNRSILSKGWYKLESYTIYKARRAGKLVVKVPAPYTSQECADCGHTHPDNRKTQATFRCQNLSCGHSDHADRNAARVIKKRAITIVFNSGTELSEKGIFTPSDTGHGDSYKPLTSVAPKAIVNEVSKKKVVKRQLVTAGSLVL